MINTQIETNKTRIAGEVIQPTKKLEEIESTDNNRNKYRFYSNQNRSSPFKCIRNTGKFRSNGSGAMNPGKNDTVSKEEGTREQISYDEAVTLIVIILLELYSVPAHVTNISKVLGLSPGTGTARTKKIRKDKLVFHFRTGRQTIHQVIEKGAASLVTWFETSEQGKRRGKGNVIRFNNAIKQNVEKGELVIEIDPLEDSKRDKEKELAAFVDDPVEYLKKHYTTIK
ncbi:MAG: hypothetical protein ACFFD4_35245 [Candidatus Odinarchaeota archaeon]